MTLKSRIKELNLVHLSLSILMTLFIWTNSLLPGHLSSEQSGFFVEIASSLFQRININVPIDQLSFWIRKLAHFTQFFILGLLWMITLNKSRLNHTHALTTVILIGLITALIDEGIQIFVPNRGSSLIDVAIDLLGVITAGLMIQIFNQLKLRQQKHTS